MLMADLRQLVPVNLAFLAATGVRVSSLAPSGVDR